MAVLTANLYRVMYRKSYIIWLKQERNALFHITRRPEKKDSKAAL